MLKPVGNAWIASCAQLTHGGSIPRFSRIWRNAFSNIISGVRIDRAFNVEKENKGGRPAKYNPTEVAAVDILLRDHANFQPEQSITWLIENINPRIDRRFVQRVRKEHNRRYNPNAAGPLMESCTRDLLLHFSGSLRKYVGKLFPNC